MPLLNASTGTISTACTQLAAERGITTVLHYGVYRGDLPLPRRGRPLHHVAALAIEPGNATAQRALASLAAP